MILKDSSHLPPHQPSSPSSEEYSDDDEVLHREVERRMAELKAKEHRDSGLPNLRYGSLEELVNEQDLLQASMHTPRLVVHFHRPDFALCRKMSEALAKLAKQHPKIRFVQVEATRAPFLTAKWAIRQLPCVVRIDEKEAVDKIVGFEGIMEDDNATAKDAVLSEKLLEERMIG